jgi:hypothetical protein
MDCRRLQQAAFTVIGKPNLKLRSLSEKIASLCNQKFGWQSEATGEAG